MLGLHARNLCEEFLGYMLAASEQVASPPAVSASSGASQGASGPPRAQAKKHKKPILVAGLVQRPR